MFSNRNDYWLNIIHIFFPQISFLGKSIISCYRGKNYIFEEGNKREIVSFPIIVKTSIKHLT